MLRDGVSVFQTNEQQHYFNCPFQLGMGSDDSPLDGDYYILDDLRHGDLIGLLSLARSLARALSRPLSLARSL